MPGTHENGARAITSLWLKTKNTGSRQKEGVEMRKTVSAAAIVLLLIALLNPAAAYVPFTVENAIRDAFDRIYPNISPSDKAQIELTDLTHYPFGFDSDVLYLASLQYRNVVNISVQIAFSDDLQVVDYSEVDLADRISAYHRCECDYTQARSIADSAAANYLQSESFATEREDFEQRFGPVSPINERFLCSVVLTGIDEGSMAWEFAYRPVLWGNNATTALSWFTVIVDAHSGEIIEIEDDGAYSTDGFLFLDESNAM